MADKILTVEDKPKVTIVEVTLRLAMTHHSEANYVDQNSIKAAINNGIETIVNCVDGITTLTDEPVEGLAVNVVRVKENGRLIDAKAFGTDDVPW